MFRVLPPPTSTTSWVSTSDRRSCTRRSKSVSTDGSQLWAREGTEERGDAAIAVTGRGRHRQDLRTRRARELEDEAVDRILGPLPPAHRHDVSLHRVRIEGLRAGDTPCGIALDGHSVGRPGNGALERPAASCAVAQESLPSGCARLGRGRPRSRGRSRRRRGARRPCRGPT